MKRIILIFTIALCASMTWARQPERGYRGFFDWDNLMELNFGFLVGEGGESNVLTGITTSHGYQFNNWLYVGGGTGFIYNLDWKQYGFGTDYSHYLIPIFAEVRFDAKWNRFTPYFSLRIGANVAECGGFYLSPTVGYRFNWGRRSAINLGLGMTMFGNTVTYSEHECRPDGTHVDFPVSHYNGNVVMFTARLGFEFQLP